MTNRNLGRMRLVPSAVARAARRRASQFVAQPESHLSEPQPTPAKEPRETRLAG